MRPTVTTTNGTIAGVLGPPGLAGFLGIPYAAPPLVADAIAALASPPAPEPQAASPTIAARPGQIGREMAVEIARRVASGGDELTIRLDPVELGRIQVRLSFDEQGSLRAVVAADSPVALEMLRRDAGELGRALTNAGVQSDAQSFQFDARGGQAGNSDARQTWGGRGEKPGRYAPTTESEPAYRPIRQGGLIDLVA